MRPAAPVLSRPKAAPAGLYLHVPYCRSICPYCDFNVYRAGGNAPYEGLAESMCRELTLRGPAFSGPLQSVYFGGGTPSLAPPEVIGGLIAHARKTLGLARNCEITLEADPGTLTHGALAALREGGVNRLSIGWQSSHDALLKTLGRPHNSWAGVEAVAMARAAGFTNISLDLIFAVPGQTMGQLEQDLQRLMALSPQHVSLYALTYHAGTPMARRIQRGTLTAATEGLELAMMHCIDERLTQHGFVHYEVSNFARGNAQAVHNSVYWAYTDYLGVGPGAHSFLREGAHQAARWANVKRPEAYMALFAPNGPSQPAVPVEPGTAAGHVDFVERLTGEQMMLEQMMVGLRLQQGLALPPVRACLPTANGRAHFDAQVHAVVQRGWGRLEGDRLVPTALGRDVCDSAAALFVAA